MLRVSLRNLLANKLRLLLTTLAIIAGVSFVSGTFILTDSISNTFDGIFRNVYHGIAVDVRGPLLRGTDRFGGGERQAFDASLVPAVRSVPGVAAADPLIQSAVCAIVDPSGQVVGGSGPPQIGSNFLPDRQLSSTPLRSGRGPAADDDVVIDVVTARSHHISIGDSIGIVVAGGPLEHFHVTGLVGFGTSDALSGATVAEFDYATADRLFQKHGRVDQIAVGAASGIADTTLRDRIQSVLPAGVQAITGGDIAKEQLQQLQTALGFLNYALLAFGLVSLFVGVFVIINSFNIMVSQRTHEMALLRVLGASRLQVLLGVLLEAATMGLMAALVGIAVGDGLARLLVRYTESSGSGIPAGQLVINGRTVLLSLAVGVLVTVGAAGLPARRATRIAPISALRESEPELSPLPWWRVAAGGVGLLIAAALLGAGLFAKTGLTLQLVGTGAGLLFVAVAILGPVLFPPVVRMLGWPAARFWGVVGRLARNNALRNPRRTASTAAALVIGVALVSLVAILASSVEGSIAQAVTGGVKTPLLVSCRKASDCQQGFSGAAADTLRADPRLGHVEEVAFGTLPVAGQPQLFEAVAPDDLRRVLNLTLTAGSEADFSDSAVLADEATAANNGWNVGSSVTVAFPDGKRTTFSVVAIYKANALLGPFVIPLGVYRAHATTLRDIAVAVEGDGSDTLAHARAALDSDLRAYPLLRSFDQSEYIAQQNAQVATLLNLVNVLLLLAIVVAAIGIVNTLALSVLERTREIGLLRALGLERRQVRSMVRWEAVSISVLGAAVGVVIGLALAAALVRALASRGLTTFDAPAGRLGIYVLIAALVGVVAAVLPARRAARVDMLRAITFE